MLPLVLVCAFCGHILLFLRLIILSHKRQEIHKKKDAKHAPSCARLCILWPYSYLL